MVASWWCAEMPYKPTVITMIKNCHGQNPDGYGGEWRGHMLPGSLFILWSLHWMQGSLRHYFSSRSRGVPFYSKACYDLPGTPVWPLEAYIVVVLTCVAAYLELFHHEDGYSPVLCGRGTLREGRFDGTRVNNTQHATMYSCFVMSGVVSILAYHLRLPAGVDKAYLALAFLGEALLMGLHDKHDPLSRVVHQVLAVSMLACSLSVAAEAVWPTSFLATCARVASTLWQGVLFVVIAQVTWCGGVAWDRSTADLVPAQFAVIATLLQSISGVCACYFAVFLAASFWDHRTRMGSVGAVPAAR